MLNNLYTPKFNNEIENIFEVDLMNKQKDNNSNEKKINSQIHKTLSPRNSIIRIILGFFALLLWIVIGLPPTLIFSSGIQTFIGIFSYFIRNPIIFLLIALINIFLGAVEYLLLGIIWWAGFHFIWSIRWFYGYFKYHKIK